MGELEGRSNDAIWLAQLPRAMREAESAVFKGE